MWFIINVTMTTYLDIYLDDNKQLYGLVNVLIVDWSSGIIIIKQDKSRHVRDSSRTCETWRSCQPSCQGVGE